MVSLQHLLNRRLNAIAGDLEAETPLLVDPIIAADGQGTITVDGFEIQCSGIKNGILRLPDLTDNVGEA